MDGAASGQTARLWVMGFSWDRVSAIVITLLEFTSITRAYGPHERQEA
jgi:hypothetical protein